MSEIKANKFILVPRLDNPGGVANYYSVLKPFLDKNCTYVYRGKSSEKNKIWRFITDYIHFYKSAYKDGNSGVILISSSLGYGGFVRDGIFSLLSTKKHKRIIFFRGWNPSFEKKINNSRILRFWLQKTFLKADHIIVLSSEFKKKLSDWGYTGQISTETTVVDEKLLNDFKFRERKSEVKNLLFLSRIEKAKGIFEAVDAVSLLLKQGRDIQLTIAGNGAAMDNLKEHIYNFDTDGITLKGYVEGEDKMNCLISADLFLFPSYHEGMPNSVLEAIAFGLPVLTTRVGGIPDFFEDGKMGLFLDNREPEHIAEKIEYLLGRPELMKEMSEYNYNYAKEHFYASKVAARLEKIIDDVVEERV
ncbi:glycosyltransferase family 1 protein [Rhodohalobacter sp. SW132]|uniref:glycosyltransferase family 4 protein n=1 Tax=Rhodohalobacter sp. SW132 TaxID=2293433 RepID=UPI000E225F3B|nr:glycosyltransferase family 4 protein [Rhodohalobacter sp. SW132]REL33825.1 glycosyltransferase family 1 protein [Rhodohalobacter sp. SW132]